jgi:hypothetical protein
MCVYATKTAKPSRSDADAFEIGQLDAPVVAYHYVLDVSLAIDEGADLSPCFVREFGQLACKFVCDDLVWRYAPSVQLFYAPQLIWF